MSQTYRRLMPRKIISRGVIAALCTLTLACSKTPEMSKISGFAQGTTYNLTFAMPADTELSISQLEVAISEELARMDKVLSNYRDDSVIEQFNAQQNTEPHTVDAELVQMVEIARSVHRASNGCYDLTIKPLFDLWGFKKDVFTPPSDDALGLTLASVGLDNLETLSPTQLRKQLPNLRIDVSSIGQGYAVERMVDILEENGIHNYLVEIGGELKVKGKKNNGEAWRIAVEKPLPKERKMHKVVSFDSGEPMSLIASGTYRHFFDDQGKRYSHILDARTGKPVEHNTVSVTILIPDATLGDAWSTAFSCLGSREGVKVANEHKLAVLFIDQDGDQLIETESDALKALNGISFKNP